MEEADQQAPGLSFGLDAEGRTLVATVAPDPQAVPLDEAWLQARLAALGYGDWHYLPQAGTLLLASYNTGRAVEVRLAEKVDAGLLVQLDTQGLEARLFIHPAQGGAPASREQVLAALAEKGVVEGFLDAAIDAAVAAGSAQGELVAQGRPPEHGQDGRLEPLVPEVRNRVPQVDVAGHTDYRDLGAILVVHPGEPLMRRRLATPGKPGRTLAGVEIPPRPGKDVMFGANLAGTSISPDDPDLLLAAITGQPVVVRGGMTVEPVFHADAVSTVTGNIDFDGTVSIGGDVAAGMTVRATGDIEVGGVVENATLEAGGSITVKGGVIGNLGHQGGGDQHVRCDGNFTAAYVQQARIEAGDSIFVDDLAMQSELSAINHIRVGHQRRGHIIGGVAHATLSITAKVVGSPNRTRTRLEVGVNPLMHKQMLDLAHDRDGRETQLLEVSKLLDFAIKHPGKLPPPVMEKARATAASLVVGIAELREAQEALNHKLELSQDARVTAEQAIHEGAEVAVGSHRYRVTGERGPMVIGMNEAGVLGPLEISG